MITVVQRQIAPHLKSLFGPWFCSLFDSSKDVAATARTAFESAFPTKKHAEVVTFCRSVLLGYVQDNFKLTEQNILDDKSISEAEKQDCYDRVISASLLAIKGVIELVPAASLAEPEWMDFLSTFTASPPVWQFGQAKYRPLVRRACFSLLQAYVTKTSILDGHVGVVAPVVLGSVGDKATMVQTVIWDLIITFIQRYPQAWDSVNAQKSVFPKLYATLRDAAYGASHILYPSFLPFLSLLSINLLNTSADSILENMLQGLYAEAITDQTAEHIVKSYYECLEFCYFARLQRLDQISGQEEFTDEIAKLTSQTYGLIIRFMLEPLKLFLTSDLLRKLRTVPVVFASTLNRVAQRRPIVGELHLFWSELTSIVSAALVQPSSLSRLSVVLCAFEPFLSSTETEGTLKTSLVALTRHTVAATLSLCFETKLPREQLVGFASFLQSLTSEFDWTVLYGRSPVDLFQSSLLPFLVDTMSQSSKWDLNADKLELVASLMRFSLDQTDKPDRTRLFENVIRVLIQLGDAELTASTVSMMTPTALKTVSTFLSAFSRGAATQPCNDYASSMLDGVMTEIWFGYQRIVSNSLSELSTQVSNQALLLGNVIESCVDPSLHAVKNIDSAHAAGCSLLSASTASTLFDDMLTTLHANDSWAQDRVRRVVQLLFGLTLVLRNDLTRVAKFVSVLFAMLDRFSSMNRNANSLDTESLLETEIDEDINSLSIQQIESEKTWDTILNIMTSVFDSLPADSTSELVQSLASAHKSALFTKPVVSSAEIHLWVSKAHGLLRIGRSLSSQQLLSWIIPSKEDLRASDTFVPHANLARLAMQVGIESVLMGTTDITSLTPQLRARREPADEQFEESKVTSSGSKLSSQLAEAKSLFESRIYLLTDLLAAEKALELTSSRENRHMVYALREFHGKGVRRLLLQASKQSIETENVWTTWLHVVIDALVKSILLGETQQLNLSAELYGSVLSEVLTIVFGPNSSWGYYQALSLFNSYVNSEERDQSFSSVSDLTNELLVRACLPELAKLLFKSTAFLSFCNGWLSRLSAIRSVLSVDSCIVLRMVTGCFRSREHLRSDELTQLLVTYESILNLSYPVDLTEAPPSLMSDVCTSVSAFIVGVGTVLTSQLTDEHWMKIEMLANRLLQEKGCPSQAYLDLLLFIQSRAASRWEPFLDMIFDLLFRKFLEHANRSSASTDALKAFAVLLSSVPSSWMLSTSSGFSDEILSLVALLSYPNLDVQKTSYVLLCNSSFLLGFDSVAQEQTDEATEEQDLQRHVDAIAHGASLQNEEQEEERRTRLIVDSILPLPLQQSIQSIVLFTHPQIGLFVQEDELIASKYFGSCLSWLLFFHVYAMRPAIQRQHLLQYLKTNSLMDSLLKSVFSLLPPHTRLPPSLLGDSVLSTEVPASNLDLSSNDLVLRSALQVYFEAVQRVPALVRIWCSSCSRRLMQKIEQITTHIVAPAVLSGEVKNIQNHHKEFKTESLTVRASKVSKEVTAHFQKDDVVLEMVIKVPPSYPLKIVEVECTKKLGIAEAKWRRWVLSIQTLLSNQNGTICDAVLLWKKNVDKVFEGVEDCPICISTIHATNHSIPRLACKTCRNKFHSACLYKWFSTSNKSECPLCKSSF
eukprot:GILJ01008498.1.p1 GENE.GILJ01008498.1~~GILJ01008498.1.p1  ORF type:complete len:1730 (-),score=257.38 GILJ01008498.1:467-5332(-)